MAGCTLGPDFWVALPATIGALGALVATLRTQRTAKETGGKVDAHRRESSGMRQHFDAVIRQLEPRVTNGEGTTK